MITKFDMNPNDDEAFREIARAIGLSQIDQQIRQAIHFCWIGLPSGKRNIDELERQIRRIVDRALRDVREDFDNFFGGTDPKSTKPQS